MLTVTGRGEIMSRFFAAILGVTLSCVLLTACTQPPPEPIKIGLAVNLSGRGGMSGEHIRDGAMLAVRDVNENGGVNGRPLLLLVQDDENSDAGIKKADQALIDENVIVIIGHTTSTNTLKSMPFVESHNGLLITPFTSTSKVSGLDDVLLRTSVDTNLYGKKVAGYFHKNQIENIAILGDMTNPGFVMDYAEQLKKHYTGNLSIVGLNSRKDVDWQQTLDKLLSPEPQLIFMLTEASMTGVATQKLREKGFTGPLMATLWAQSPALFDYGGEAIEGLSIITFISPENDRLEYLDFAKKIQDSFNKPATARSTRSYEVIMIITDALKRCKEITTAELKKQLLAKKYTTLMGEVKFDQYGDVIRPVYEVTVRDGKFQTKGKI